MKSKLLIVALCSLFAGCSLLSGCKLKRSEGYKPPVEIKGQDFEPPVIDLGTEG